MVLVGSSHIAVTSFSTVIYLKSDTKDLLLKNRFLESAGEQKESVFDFLKSLSIVQLILFLRPLAMVTFMGGKRATQ